MDLPDDIETPDERIDRAIYAMPQWSRLPVTDLDASTRWYVDAVGFVVLATMPGLVHLRRFRYQDILLVAASATVRPGSGSVGVAAGFGEDLTARAATARHVPGGRVEGPTPTAWNTVDLTFTDTDGYVVVLSQPKPFDQFDPRTTARLQAAHPTTGSHHRTGG